MDNVIRLKIVKSKIQKIDYAEMLEWVQNRVVSISRVPLLNDPGNHITKMQWIDSSMNIRTTKAVNLVYAIKKARKQDE